MPRRKKKTTNLDYWLGGSVRPVFVLDSERRIGAVSAGFQALTGWAPGDVLGVACHYGSVSEIAGAAALAASICPPPEVFAGREASAPACLVRQDGSTLSTMLHFFPLCDERGNQQGILGVVGDGPAAPGGAALPPRYELHAELAALQARMRARFGSQTIVARSTAMRRVLGQMHFALQSQAPVLFSGGPGAGKEHLARLVHFNGPARTGSFVSLDCRRLGPDEMYRIWGRIIESRRIEASSGSSAAPLPATVFLADVEFAPRDLQERLVAAFAEPGPLRLLASTTLSPVNFAARGDLRPDFHAIISPLTIELPPLSQRTDDLPVLAQYFLEELNRQSPKQIGGFDEQVWPLFARYSWPQNVDELAKVVGEAHLHATDSTIHPSDLPFRFRNSLSAQDLPPSAAPPHLLLDPLLTKVETELIGLALKRCRNNRTRAAELLGITRTRLLRRIEQLQIGLDDSATPGDEPEAVSEVEALDDLTEP
jgi:DNA-binding NtrC family response regulator